MTRKIIEEDNFDLSCYNNADGIPRLHAIITHVTIHILSTTSSCNTHSYASLFLISIALFTVFHHIRDHSIPLLFPSSISLFGKQEIFFTGALIEFASLRNYGKVDDANSTGFAFARHLVEKALVPSSECVSMLHVL